MDRRSFLKGGSLGGGATPWGTWLSCEANGTAGQAWECDPLGVQAATVRPAMGAFNHEAAADPMSTAPPPGFARRLTAEAVGTGLLVAIVVGSGIAAERLSPGDVGLQLLENSLATAGGLVALILAFGPVSGAHLNPVVSLADRLLGHLTTRELAAYTAVQVVGACAGAVTANLMFDLPAVTASTHERATGGLWLGEVVATFGLVTVILGVVRGGRASAAPFAVAGYIAAAYWFTSSTSFANPAVTVGRTLSDTFAGIAPASAPAFVAAQVVGGGLAVALARFLHPGTAGPELVVAHDQEPTP